MTEPKNHVRQSSCVCRLVQWFSTGGVWPPTLFLLIINAQIYSTKMKMLADVLSCLVIILWELSNWIVCPVKERSKNFAINIFLNPFWKWSPRGPPVERLWPNAPVTKPEYYFRNVYIKLHRAKIWVEDTPRWTFEQRPKKPAGKYWIQSI